MTKVIDNDLGYTVIIKGLEKLGGQCVEAGVFANAGTEKDGRTKVADVAIWNEYGVDITVTPKMRGYLHTLGIHLSSNKTTIHIPARPFMRQAADANMDKWGDTAERLMTSIINGMSAEQALELLGNQAKGDIQAIFTRGDFAPNSPATIARKKSSRPLIDTGRLRNSVDFRIKKG